MASDEAKRACDAVQKHFAEYPDEVEMRKLFGRYYHDSKDDRTYVQTWCEEHGYVITVDIRTPKLWHILTIVKKSAIRPSLTLDEFFKRHGDFFRRGADKEEIKNEK